MSVSDEICDDVASAHGPFGRRDVTICDGDLYLYSHDL